MQTINRFYAKYQLTISFVIPFIFFYFNRAVNEARHGHLIVGCWSLLVLLVTLAVETQANRAATAQQTRRIKVVGASVIGAVILLSIIPLCWYLLTE
ncbi:hypothetical protein [Lactobacillus xylocopicola]|uniref:Uncharacterized protein n=1 Tax=Lactobacillus xylocopicola TaxID=2976676 RepID=A0ABM8BII7_9LACO|nr:hypothetical protein [Lactobacillus xylocopicola]BDR61109.1 hypothetical protein KIM322_13700 [Lactobacillus xylocopicola]